MSLCCATNSSDSISDTLYPLIPAASPNRLAAAPAIHTPNIVPKIAARDFVLMPPTVRIVTKADSAATMTAPQNGENPLYTNGKNTRKTETIETPRHNADFSPFFPPTSHRLNMNISTKQMIGIVLSRL